MAQLLLDKSPAMKLENLIEKANDLRIGPFEPFQHPRPTAFSIRRINEHFNMTLPGSFLEFVRSWHDSGRLFAGLGNDCKSPEHIIRINSYYRRRRITRRIPRNLVIFNLCHDEDCDCFDLDRYDPATGEYEIRYWYPGFKEVVTYPSFVAYMEEQVAYWIESRKRNDNKVKVPKSL